MMLLCCISVEANRVPSRYNCQARRGDSPRNVDYKMKYC